MIVSLPKSLTDRPVLLSCLVFTSVAAIWYLQRKSPSNHQVSFIEAILSYHLNRPRYLTTSGTGFKGVPPISTVSTPIHRLSQLWSKLAALLRIPISNQIYLHAKNSSKIMFVWWTGHLLTVMWALQTALCCRTSALLQAGVQYHTLKSRFEKIIKIQYLTNIMLVCTVHRLHLDLEISIQE